MAAAAAGLRVVERPGWATHNRNAVGRWGPVNGVMVHHTVTRGTESSLRLVERGHGSLPGPLYAVVVDKDGTIYLTGWGRCNHGGLGDDDVHAAVINEAPLPADNEANTDGNRSYYGITGINLGDGKDPWPAPQLRGLAVVAAVICRHHRWTERSVIGHSEWQPGKVDPRGPGVTMAGIRRSVGAELRPATAPKPTPAPAPRKEPELSTDQKIANLYRNLTRIGSLTEREPDGEREMHAAGYYLAHIERDTTEALTLLRSIDQRLTALEDRQEG